MLITGRLVSPESAPDQCEAEISSDTAPDGIKLASSSQATGVAPMPGAPDDATGSALLLGAFGLPFDLPLLPCANTAAGTRTTSALSMSALVVKWLSNLLAMFARCARRGPRHRPGRRA